MKAAIIFGSRSDTEKMKGAAKALSLFGIEYKSFVLSAHRVPEALRETIKSVEDDGAEIIISGAGLAAHLPGVIASQTILPVIGVPLNGALDGQDALYSIVQMPKSIPVATVGIDNSFNAGMLAVEILALKYSCIREKLIQYRIDMKNEFLKNNGEIEL